MCKCKIRSVKVCFFTLVQVVAILIAKTKKHFPFKERGKIFWKKCFAVAISDSIITKLLQSDYNMEDTSSLKIDV